MVPDQSFVIFDNRFSGAVSGFFDSLPEGQLLVTAATTMQITYVGGDGNDVVLTVVPEPVSLVAISVSALMLLRWRRTLR